MKRKIKGFVFGLGFVGLYLWVLSCAPNPVTGRQELMLLSESDEIKLGQETDLQIIKEYGLYEDPKLTAYLSDIGRRLGKLSHRPNLPYHFKILDVSVVNAFAVPGGYVYFTRGILAALNSEAELAGVMGHEIGHITARHSAQQYSRAQLAQIGLGVGSLFVDSSALMGLAQLGVGMLFLRFSRDNERQADDLGVEYSSRGGYDASQLANFFETLDRINPGSDRSGLPGWFSTHPSPVDRIQTVRSRAREWHQRLNLKDPRVDRDLYLRMIDGLIYGEDPRQGYVMDQTFYHPGLQFQFPVPVKWKISHTRSRVQMLSEKEDAAILFSIAQGTSPQEAARKFLSESRASVIRSEAIEVNGLRGHRLHSEVRSQKGIYQLLSYFIEKGKHMFTFHGVTTHDRFEGYRTVFDHTMRQFKELTDPKRIDVQPDRIRLHQVKTGGPLEGELRSLGFSDEEMKVLALLNGRDLREVVPAHTLLKVIEKGSLKRRKGF